MTAKSLRSQIDEDRLLVVPGAYDALTARLVAEAGFSAVYMSGAAVSIAHGYPDYGLLTLTEMAEAAGIMARSVNIPVIADADTGFGNELNTTRAVQEYERLGVAAIQIEDQVSPKKCGHLDNKEVIPRGEFVSKIRAAVAARKNRDFLIVARTDSRAIADLDEAVARANLALEAGADIAFVEAPQTLDEMMAVPKLVAGPCLLNIVPGGKTPDVDLAQVSSMGYRVVILPGLLFATVMDSCVDVLSKLKEHAIVPSSSFGPPLRERFRRLGAEEWDVLRSAYAPAGE